EALQGLFVLIEFPIDLRTPYQWNCDDEIDDKGKLCKGWAEGGLCTMHKATMFLFCRKTCLCVGPSV
ncbi:unnamed protein product, partial [Angiostrongylus costaricensis]|uniref:ShKT domain-containing protein n=1 Tax=Angiostrongylus costaricensis TaxID=334426 RepID=A0A0R3PBF5_ANGCS